MRTGSPYERIDSQMGEIRLLRIQPGAYDDDLVITLDVVVLSDEPIYQALSYVWGDTTPVATCFLDRIPFPLNRNLNRALRRFREESDELVLWADALCINQTDLDERAAQVRIMPRIFEGADSIFAWLGDPQDDECIQAAIAMMGPLCDFINNDMDSLTGAGDSFDYDKHAAYFPVPANTELWRAWEGCTEMFTCEYWNRLWTLQEAATPTAIVFYYGYYEFRMEQVQAIVIWVTSFRLIPGWPPHLARVFDDAGDISRTIYLREDRQFKKNEGVFPSSFGFLSLLEAMRGSLCTDPLDRIYAPLGLAHDVPMGSISIDYSCNVDDLYCRVAEYFITGSADPLAILGHCHNDEPRYFQCDEKPLSPSWVPDWRWVCENSGLSHEQYDFLDAGVLYDPFAGVVCAHVQERALSVEGLILHSVEIVSLTDTWTELESIQTPRSWYELLMRVSDPSPELELAIRRSLVGDAIASPEEKKIWRGAAIDLAFFQLAGSLSGQMLPSREACTFDMLRWICFTRRMAMLNNSRVAVLPGAAQIGDKVAAFRGGHALYLIRPLSNSEDYHLVGECYVDGWMDGQIVEELGEENVETITLV
ncbi:hypothetical protein E8E11_001892 [Didymella keratinophila]|nr:hypothetical protein E8E11_001892 [Didymella keratinophila]